MIGAYLGAVVAPKALYERQMRGRLGDTIHEVQSAYSHIRVRERGSVRSLLFVDKFGVEQRQSAIDMDAPEEMQLGYTRSLFASFLFRHPQERVLIVGLGGGGMVRFLNHHFSETHVEAVEIDPEVVRIAADYFGTRESEQTTIHTEDAFVYLREPKVRYDAIYMDAFLKPSADARLENVTQRLKTEAFLRSLQAHLKPDGLVAFNLIKRDPSTSDDIEAIQMVFPAVFVFDVPETGNLVIIGTLGERHTKERLLRRATELDELLKIGLSFQKLVKALRGDGEAN
ncbi:MAG: spermidine synthase [Verrucomicrobiales bacterium]|jgi:spermidine synthase